jgi:hypothetical protein
LKAPALPRRSPRYAWSQPRAPARLAQLLSNDRGPWRRRQHGSRSRAVTVAAASRCGFLTTPREDRTRRPVPNGMNRDWRIVWLVVGGLACLDWGAKIWLLSALLCTTCLPTTGCPHVRGGRPATPAHGTDLGGRCPLRRLRRRYPRRRSVARALRPGKCDARSNVGEPLKVSDAALTKNGPAAARPFSEESRSGGSPGRKPPRPRRRRRAAEAAPGHPPPETASSSC